MEKAKDVLFGRNAIVALGEIGDPRAIPVLIDCLKEASKDPRAGSLEAADGVFRLAVWALGDLHHREAVPLLLEHVEIPDVVDALERLGDPGPCPHCGP